MKKYLPLLLLGVGILILLVVFIFVRSRKVEEEPVEEEETALIQVELKDRPVVSLIPTEDGHFLLLKVEKITIDAKTVDYELLYDTEANVTQGVPGTIQLTGLNSFEEKLLLGSESSGKFRYDDGVEKGTITLRFRNEEGKLLIKFVSDFHMQTGISKLSTIDDAFKYELEDLGNSYFVTMNTVGYPDETLTSVDKGPFGVFASSNDKFQGKVDMGGGSIYRWDGGNWQKLENNSSENVGIFYSSSN
ncbi:hypothetical protein A2863_00020 [Candidatus Woesebacteria bacterium RIFCSPHIGHO2_01_FULL_38_9b]|uniref:Uncharacterized protein n=1 Tax=Candidatus Woesebacteria bacterium RIFCSPHIGHO2_01_FULL_38_9b TaxID=1802493 RepID=A0A1F7Y3U7_9BACT|nr:MAG: hypothetical protein A2863_00020 [Candidatus Woesebacteria bacterium RIFCSPHIGHO2_01_FULL_38_9b]